MTLLIAADIHGSAYWCRKLLRLMDETRADKLLLLGDLFYRSPQDVKEYDPEQVMVLLGQYAERILAVRGNCEKSKDDARLPFSCEHTLVQTEVDGIPFMLTHGHIHSPETMPDLHAGSIFLFGHTHSRLDTTRDGVRILNPGSLALPKDGRHSCILYKDGDFRFLFWEDDDVLHGM